VNFVPGTFQRIRLTYEVLDQHSGNCIELSQLYASAAEALKLQSAIILIPGHAFLAVRMDDTNAQYYVIETTFIGRYSFADAVQKGATEFQDAQPHITAGDNDYGWVNISDGRAKGINPLPWH
jgi:hypothetical protein